MKLDPKYIGKMSELQTERELRRQQLSDNLTILRRSLQPTNLTQRVKGLAKANLVGAGDKAAVKVRENSGLIAAIGSGLAIVALYKPLKALWAKSSTDSEPTTIQVKRYGPEQTAYDDEE